jgi:hypothetical protein
METKNNKILPCVILSYGRSDRVFTYETLRNQGYSGKIYIVCSDDDKELKNYKLKFENVLVFNKQQYESEFDIGDNFKDYRVVVFARNAVFDLMEKQGEEFFIVLDDDYREFRFTCDDKFNYLTKLKKIKNLDRSFNSMLDFYKNTNAKTLCISQGGDFIGGENSSVFKKKLARKAMNFFICSTKRKFNFIGRINEDVCTYVRFGSVGDLFFTIAQLRLEQIQTQSNAGGLTEFYLDGGTYVKSFYTILFNPSSVKISMMGNKNRRLHHLVKWNNTVPVIVSENLKK